MALDSSEGCNGCGILLHSNGPMLTDEWRSFCRACACAEQTAAQTPCGQCYCRLCGILIDSAAPSDPVKPDHCSACQMMRSLFIGPGNSSKASRACECDFCGNDYNMSPPARKFIQLNLEPAALSESKTNKNGASKLKETIPVQAGERRPENLNENLRNKWERQQQYLKRRLVTEDSDAVKEILQAIISRDTSRTFYIGGVDISFIKDNNVDACAALVILSFPELKVVYKRLEMIKLTAPYIPGFLAFREADSLIALYKTMLKNAPQYKPDVIFVDGNGRLHPRGFGLACHLGVLLDVPCLGVAKTLISVGGIEDNADHKAKKQSLRQEGDSFPLTTRWGDTLGVALRGTRSAPNPVYVSLGHKVSLSSAVTLVHKCCRYRIPEPTRYADLCSRQYLAEEKHDPEELIVREGESCPNEWQ